MDMLRDPILNEHVCNINSRPYPHVLRYVPIWTHVYTVHVVRTFEWGEQVKGKGRLFQTVLCVPLSYRTVGAYNVPLLMRASATCSPPPLYSRWIDNFPPRVAMEGS